MSENRFHTKAHAGDCALLDVFSPLYKTDPAHDMVAVFDAEYLSDLFWYRDSSSGYDLGEVGNVFLIYLYGQCYRNEPVQWANNITFREKPGLKDQFFATGSEKFFRATLPSFSIGLAKMLIQVRVTTNAKTPSVKETGKNALEVRVDERAVDGRANKRLLGILSEHYKVPRSSLTILRGARSRDKIIEIREHSAKRSA